MAQYKIPQDVEAEDKLLGPFTFKQFIFLVIAAICMALCYVFYRLYQPLVLIPLPITILCLVLGIYRRPDQPVELYLLAMLNFRFKPRVRKWNSEGLHENIHLVPPKRKPIKPDKVNVKLVHGQLEQLAKIVDSRGWAAKDPNISVGVGNLEIDDGDRLISMDSLNAKPDEPVEVHSYEDMLDINNNPDAKDIAKLEATTTSAVKAQAIAKMQMAKSSTKST